jgi:penicillin amidase
MLVLGEDTFNKLYPDFGPHITPVMNKPSQRTSIAFQQLKKPAYLDYAFLSSTSSITPSAYNPRLGSNSWAVSGKKRNQAILSLLMIHTSTCHCPMYG